MSEASYYPAGAYRDTMAPYNEVTPPDIKVDVCTSQSLSKTVSVTTNNYTMDGCEDEHPDYDFSDTNWTEEYHDNDHYTPQQLMELFKQCLITMHEHGYVFKSPGQDAHLIKECEGWTVDDEYICLDN